MSDRFEVKLTDKEEVKLALGVPLKRSLNDKELGLVCIYLKSNSVQGDILNIPEEEPRTGFSMRPGGSEYHINVENTLLISAAVFLDALATAGIASALLVASGKKLQAVSRLDPTSGALCNYITLEKIGNKGLPIAADQVLQSTSGQPCRHPQFSCCHKSNDQCGIKSIQVAANLSLLEQKTIVRLDETGAITKIS